MSPLDGVRLLSGLPLFPSEVQYMFARPSSPPLEIMCSPYHSFPRLMTNLCGFETLPIHVYLRIFLSSSTSKCIPNASSQAPLVTSRLIYFPLSLSLLGTLLGDLLLVKPYCSSAELIGTLKMALFHPEFPPNVCLPVFSSLYTFPPRRALPHTPSVCSFDLRLKMSF